MKPPWPVTNSFSLSLLSNFHCGSTPESRWSLLLHRHQPSSIKSMDRASLLLLVIILFSIYLFSDLTTADKTIDLAAESGMIFPLSYSSLPPRVEEDFRRRRRLHQSQLPNAHMNLYDDLLANGFEFSSNWLIFLFF